MNKVEAFQKRKNRVRSKISGTAAKPRLSVCASNKHIIAQIIDDGKGVTIAYATDTVLKDAKGTKTEKAILVGKEIAAKAKAKKVGEVVFDRGGKLYHGRVKALADAAREAGLKF
jgi:large subunit ribosomal protein L18